jgi:hypothetical protein
MVFLPASYKGWHWVVFSASTVLTYPEVFTLLGVRVAQSKTDRPQIQGLNTDYRRKPYEPHHRILKAKRTF